MANYATLKAAIQQYIKQNGNNEITGALLQQSLLSMIDSLGAGYQYAGVVTPTTNPGTPDYNVFCFAKMPGTYTNFGGLVVNPGELAIFHYNGNWGKSVIPIPVVFQNGQNGVTGIINGLSRDNVLGAFPLTNLVNPDLLFGCVVHENTGVIDDWYGDNFGLTDYIPVNGQNIIARAFYNTGEWAAGIVYDANKNFLRTINGTNQYTYQSGDYYVRFCIYQAQVLTNRRANYGTTLADYTEYNPLEGYATLIANVLQRAQLLVSATKYPNGVAKLLQGTEEITDILRPLPGTNLINPYDITPGSIVSKDGVIHSGYGAYYAITGYIPVNGQDIIANAFYTTADQWAGGAVYDENKNLLRTLIDTNQYTYEDGDYYVRFNFAGANNVTNLYANYGTTLESYIEYNPLGGYSDMIGAIVGNAVSLNNLTKYAASVNRIKQNHAIYSKISCVDDQDVYLTLWGDSIMAWQSSTLKAKEGVCSVPPVCDKQGLANKIWERYKVGDVYHRRFDWGKKSLVGDYSDEWADDSNAFFVETGTFYTQYARDGYQPNQSAIQITTLISNGHFSTPFDTSETNQMQRNIPKRFSNSANASVQFRIPAGYKKFDFIYHAHILGDDVVITTNRGNGYVKYNTKPNDWSNGIEANNAQISLGFNTTDSETYGCPNRRIYFQLTDASVDTVVTITKSSNTSKYLIYWGVAYWGTNKNPYALHVQDMARGGYALSTLNPVWQTDLLSVNTDALYMEITAINNFGNTYDSAQAAIKQQFETLIGYWTQAGFNVPKLFLIPHPTKAKAQDQIIAKSYYKYCYAMVLKNDYDCVAVAYDVMESIYNEYFIDEYSTFADFIQAITLDNTHPNNLGFSIYEAIV